MSKSKDRLGTSSVLWRTLKMGGKIMPIAFIVMLIINMSIALLPLLGVRWSRSVYLQAQIASEGTFQPKTIIIPLLLYALYLIIMKLHLILYQRVLIQFGSLPTFEKRIKAILHNKCGSIRMQDYENPKFFNRVWEAKVASINISHIIECVIYFITITISILAMGGYVASIHPAFFSLVALAAIPSFVERVASGVMNKNMQKMVTQLEKEERAHRNSLFDVTRYKEIRAYNISEKLIKKWKTAVNRLQAQIYSKDQQLFWIRSILRLLKTVALIGAYMLSALLFYRGNIDYNAFMASLTASLFMQTQYSELFDDMGHFSEFLLLVKPFFQFMDMENTLSQHISPQELTLSNISYRYPSSQMNVLDNLSMHVQSGEIVVVVGVNGAGKSTLAKILMGYLQPYDGSYIISPNDLDTRDNPSAICMPDFSAMFQDYCKYALSIRDNITFSDISKAQEEKTRKLAELFGIIQLMNQKEVLGREFGTYDLSGGQWQRVAMARCFFQEKPFFILDEPTSAIDPLQEKDINKCILSLAEGKTMIVISHRLSVARVADRVLVLDNGTIVQEGTHSQLLKDKKGLYKQLWAAQSTWYQD